METSFQKMVVHAKNILPDWNPQASRRREREEAKVASGKELMELKALAAIKLRCRQFVCALCSLAMK